MARLERRQFLAALTAAPAATMIAGDLWIAPDDRARLIALAEAVLPSELGSDGVTRAAERFERWVGAFRPGAELNHGYGTGRLQHAPPDPWPQWRAQLDNLDARSGGSFQRAPIARRRELVTTVLDELKADRIPNPLQAPHVSLALLSWWLSTPEANDLCFQADIRRESCRALGSVVDAPRAQRGRNQ